MSSNEHDYDKQLEEYKNKCKKDAEKLVKDVFPKKVLELNTLLESEKFNVEKVAKLDFDLNIPVPEPFLVNNHDNTSDEQFSKKRKLEAISSDGDLPMGSKVLILPNGAVPVSRPVTELVDIVKPKIREVIEHANQIKMWLAYSIPKIEDGNNFGVGIQEDTLAEARTVETEAATFLDQISRYYLTRGKIVAKIAKYPHIEDFRRSVLEVDQKQMLNSKWMISEMRNQIASLHDMITKNLDKIKKPRNANAENMY